MGPDPSNVHEQTASRFGEFMIHLKHIERVAGEAGWAMKPRFAAEPALIVAAAGGGLLYIGSSSFRFRPDRVYVCPAGETFGAEAGPHEGLTLFLLRFDMYAPSLTEAAAPELANKAALFGDRLELPAPSSVRPAITCHTIYDCRSSDDELDKLRASIVFQQLVHSLLKHNLVSPQDSQTALDRTKAYMEERFHENLTIDELARMAEISPKYFVELFKKTYGVSAIDYVSELRIAKAKRLLARLDVRLRDIAHHVGYSDEFYFSRKFKKEVGVSPTAYAESRRQKIAAYGMCTMGQLLPLHMIPYAAPMHPKWTDYYYRKYRDDVPVHLSAHRRTGHWEANIGKLREAPPDAVISMDHISDAEKERLNEVAPVLYIPWNGHGWRDHLLAAAEYLGATGEAERWLAQYDRRVRFVRERVQRAAGNETFLTIAIFKQRCYVYCNRSMLDVFYGDLRLAPHSAVQSGIVEETITPDRLAELDPDRLLVNVAQEAESLNHFRELQGTMPWQELQAVREHKVYAVSSDPWREYTASAHLRIVEETMRLLADNNPK